MIKLQSEECVPASPRAHPGSPSPPPPPPPFTSSHNLYFHTCSVCTQEPKSKQTFGAPLCDRHMNMLFQKLYFAWCYCTFFISGITCWFLLKPERRHIFNLSSVLSNVSLQHFSIISWTKYFLLQLSQKGGETFLQGPKDISQFILYIRIYKMSGGPSLFRLYLTFLNCVVVPELNGQAKTRWWQAVTWALS